MEITDGFESAVWHHRVHVYDAATHALKGGAPAEYGNMFIPQGWEFGYVHGRPVLEDPSNGDGWAQPEARFSEHFTNRLHKGIRSFMWFGFFRSTDSWLYRQFTVNDGDLVEAEVYAHAWSSNGNDPYWSDGVGRAAFACEVGTPGLSDEARNCSFVVGIDPTGGTDAFSPTVQWGVAMHAYNVFVPIQARAVADGTKVTVFIRSRNIFRLQHNDFYFDSFTLRTVQQVPESPALAKPRLDFARVTLLVRQDATQEQWLAACAYAYHPDRRWTVSRSEDHSGYAPGLSSNTVLLAWFGNDTWDRNAEVAFFAEYYPNVTVEDLHFEPESPPEEPEEPPEEPPTPPSPKPPTFPAFSMPNSIGLHSMFTRELWDTYTAQGKARVVKVFSAGQAWEAKCKAPGALVVWRKHVSNDGAFRDFADRRLSAKTFLDLYLEEGETAAHNLGVPFPDLMRGLVIESINEVYPSGTEETGAIHPAVPAAVEFDLYFEEAVRGTFAGQVGAGLATIAIGNPGRHEVGLLLPLAKVCHEHRLNKLAYHAYWDSNQVDAKVRRREDLLLVKGWKYHAGRWTEWDKIFNQAGYYPEYYFGEGGMCKRLQPNDGWKSCGSFEDYLFQIDVFDDLVREWNAAHGDRAYGITLFTYGGWGWESFDFDKGEAALLLSWARRKYGL